MLRHFRCNLMKPVALVDIDEVLFPFSQAYSRWLRRTRGISFVPELMATYDLAATLGAEHFTMAPRFLSDPHTIELERPIDDAVEAIWELTQVSDVLACTHRPEDTEGVATVAWISRHVPAIKRVLFTRFDPTARPGPKSEIARRTGARILIDDTPENLVNLPRDCSGLLVQRPGGIVSDPLSRSWSALRADRSFDCLVHES